MTSYKDFVKMLAIWKLRRLIIIVISLSQLHPCQSELTTFKDDPNVPCTILETVNITTSVRLKNGSYLHEGIVYPPHLVGTYNYLAKNLTNREFAEPHLRGCLCKIKQCINVCCPKHQYNSSKKCTNADMEINSDIQIYRNDNSYQTRNLFGTFGILVGKPCLKGYNIDMEENREDEWRLYENGTIYMVEDDLTIPQNEFCMNNIRSPHTTSLRFTPMICFKEVPDKISYTVYSYTLFLSVPFLILTIAVYTIIPQLRNLHGKSLSCYLLGLTIGYTLLAYQLVDPFYSNTLSCAVVGYIVYYSLMASFFWLSVISFDLWWNFKGTRGVNKLNESKKFILYSVYSWGLALVFLTIVLVAQNSELPRRFKPGIGDDTCFLNDRLWIQLAYFYGPILLVILFNTIVFILTAVHIYKAQQEINKTMAMKESSRNFRNDKDNVALFLRLFLVMGITWIMEIVSWLAGHQYDVFFYITDVCNAALGFLIFVFFVLKKRVLSLIIKRYQGLSSKSSNTETSRTDSSSIPMASLNRNDPNKSS